MLVKLKNHSSATAQRVAGSLQSQPWQNNEKKLLPPNQKSAEKTRQRPRTPALFLPAVLHLDDAVEHLSTRER
jgi:hypothetical protein